MARCKYCMYIACMRARTVNIIIIIIIIIKLIIQVSVLARAGTHGLSTVVEMKPNPFCFSLYSQSQVGILPFLAPIWVAWILAGIVLHLGVQWKRYLPYLITDIMEYGKCRERLERKKITVSSLPKRYYIITLAGMLASPITNFYGQYMYVQ